MGKARTLARGFERGFAHREPGVGRIDIPTADVLMRWHINTLFECDKRDRMVRVNDWRIHELPRIYLGKTVRGNEWRFRGDLDESTCRALAHICESEPRSLDRPDIEKQLLEVLESDTDTANINFGPAYYFSKAPSSVESTALLDIEDAGFLKGGLEDWIDDLPHQRPFAVAIKDRRAVSVCASVRIGRHAHEAGVETLPDYRREGHAFAAVSCWGKAVWESGALPMYSTSHDNLASQALAGKLHLTQYGIDYSIT